MITKTTVTEMNDYTIAIGQDCDCECPLSWNEDRLKVYVQDGKRIDCAHNLDELETCIDDNPTFKGFMENVRKETGCYVFALVRYEHSGVSYYIGNPTCPWDFGFIGIVTVDKEHYETEDSALEYTNAVMEVLTLWANGECYYYDITDNSTGELVDGCCGYIGYDNALECAKECIPEGKDYNVINKD